jgi:hypothetical protein
VLAQLALEAFDLSGAWSNDVKLAVPDTGISPAEIVRLLKARFGHDFVDSNRALSNLQGKWFGF